MEIRRKEKGDRNNPNWGVRHKVTKVEESNQQSNSTFTLRICHCAECGTRQNLKNYHFHSKAIPNCEAPSQELFWERHHHVGAKAIQKVSILVLVDDVLEVGLSFLWCGSLCCFNPCFGGWCSGRKQQRVFFIQLILFQSLFWWMMFWKNERADQKPQRILFQSLFWWMMFWKDLILVDFYL